MLFVRTPGKGYAMQANRDTWAAAGDLPDRHFGGDKHDAMEDP